MTEIATTNPRQKIQIFKFGKNRDREKQKKLNKLVLIIFFSDSF